MALSPPVVATKSVSLVSPWRQNCPLLKTTVLDGVTGWSFKIKTSLLKKSSDMVAFAFYLFVAESSSKTSVVCTSFALAAVVIVQGVL